jgi:hypothetical protein
MDVKIDLIDKHDTTIVDELLARRTAHADVIKQNSDPADERLIAVRERAEGHLGFSDLEEIYSLFSISPVNRTPSRDNLLMRSTTCLKRPGLRDFHRGGQLARGRSVKSSKREATRS